MKPLISVVVPVYKAEQYLERCVEGLLRQTYENYEILLVDDGSPDRSGEICEEYAENYENVRVVHQKNQGPGPARNHGVQAAKGEYIVFMDADDGVSVDYLDYLETLMEKYQVELAAVSGFCVWDSREHIDFGRVYPVEQEKKLSRVEALKAMCYGKEFGVAPWGKIYRRRLLLDHPYPACIHEDLAGTYHIIAACDTVAVGKKRIYYYFQNDNSIMSSKIEERHLYGLTAAREELEYMEMHYPEVVPAAQYRCGLKIIEYIPRLLDGSAESKAIFKRLKAEMKRYVWKIIGNDQVGKIFKIRCLAVCAGYPAACSAWKMIRWLKKKTGKEGI